MKLEIKDATLGYGRKTVLENVDLDLNTNQTICVLGKNGAGKTTLFKSLLGVLPLLSGDILLDGKSIRKWSRRHYARLVAYVPQARSLPFPFKVTEVVLFGRTAHLSEFSSPGKKDRLIAEECLELLNISHLRNRIFTQLSGGEQQMVIIARALAQQPAFIIMDEPTSSLDFGNQIKVIRQVNRLRSNSLGILMATHSPDHAFMCNADVSVVHNGSLRWRGHCNTVINETLLQEIYGVRVSIAEASGGCSRKVCIPTVE
ncbi:MAG: ABC transporter ATP-binding protein [Prevotella sp.]|nr:ABC transporter ATP-binding protein [Prevotella sp.]